MGERVAMISLHTSPLDQPGTGDAGGMNVYVIELAKRLGAQGIDVDVFTRATSSALPQVVEAADGVLVRHIAAGPFEGLAKGELPGQLCTFAREVLRTEALQPLGHYDAVHSHYWLSGQVGALARDRWNVPLVHSMHTMAKVKNEALAVGDTPEPMSRVIGEEQVVEAADLLVANTDTEARQLVDLYDASPDAVEVIHPGVDLTVFAAARPRRGTAHARPARGRRRADVRRPDPAAQGARRAAPRGRGDARATTRRCASDSSYPSSVDPPAPASSTPPRWPTSPPSSGSATSYVSCRRWRRASWPSGRRPPRQWPCRPTTSRSASSPWRRRRRGTPVVAAAVGGLTTVVRDGVSGLLVDTHEPRDWAAALRRLVDDPALVERLGRGAIAHAQDFSWEHTAERTLVAYERAAGRMRAEMVS